MDATRNKSRELTHIALFAVLMAVCSWLCIPMAPPFTMQTFAVFCALGLLGGRRACLAVLVYILLGAVGLPVFAGFGSGPGVLLGPTGGYIIGFLCGALVYRLWERLVGTNGWRMAVGMALALLTCYAFGSVWYAAVYTRGAAAVGLSAALIQCVLPFILPDIAKLALALWIIRALPRQVKLYM